jgi:hypothetical protein
LDFIQGLRRSGHADCILEVVDTFSKYDHFIGLLHPFMALKVAQIFIAHVSDRDKIFTSTLWQELFHLSDTQLQMSTTYHPQSDGQTKRVNQCLETFLRSFVHWCPTNWSAWLPQAEFWYNTCPHSSLGMSPFEVLYGRAPRHLGILPADAIISSDLSEWLSQREVILHVIKHNLLRAKQRMKHQADKGRSEREFVVGDFVFVKLHAYVQGSVAPQACHKLSFKFFGPFEILQRVGPVAYRLKLPEDAVIHPVFHVSQLKQYISPSTPVSATVPTTELAMQFPAQILDRHSLSRGGSLVAQVLVHWSGMDKSLASWEDEAPLRMKFLAAAAWGQAPFQGGGNVSPCTQDACDHNQDMQNRRAPREMGRRARRPNVRFADPEWRS